MHIQVPDSPLFTGQATYCNYVVFFPKTKRIKIGITGNPKQRAQCYKQEANRHDLGYVAFNRGTLEFKGVANMVEKTIRDVFKDRGIGTHREWFEGDAETFEAFKKMTSRLQKEVRELLHIESNNA